MRAVIQRVLHSKVVVGQTFVSGIEQGLLVFCAAELGDTDKDTAFLARKIASLRVFDNENGRMDRDITQAGGSILLVSNFTLLGDCSKGTRPTYKSASPLEEAEFIVEKLAADLRALSINVKMGSFGKHMKVLLENDGPVTLTIDSRKST